MRNIIKAFGGRYIHQGKVNTVICPMFFKQILLAKNYKEQANKELLNNLRYFFEVMKRLDKDDKVLIYEKYFKYATLRISSEPNSNVYRKHTVKHVPNYEHAHLMDISLVKYNKLLRRAMTNYLKILISLKDKKEDENDKREN